MNMLSSEDLTYYTQQSEQNIEKILTGMLMLINDNEFKIKNLENQNWFNRMIKTLFGKNKITIEEIRKNKEQIDIYIAETILELNKKVDINQNILILLDKRINRLLGKISNLTYEYLDLQNSLKIFAENLDKQIKSVDNFSVIISKKNLYEKMNILVAISDILSKMDEKIIESKEKMEIITDNMKNWLNDTPVFLKDLFKNLMELNEYEINIIYLTLDDFRNGLLIDLILETIERKFYFQEKDTEILEDLFFKNRIDEDISLTRKDIFFNLLNCKKEFIDDLSDNDDQEKLIDIYMDENLKEQTDISYLLFKAENGDQSSQYEVGKYFFDLKDFSKSLYWFERAANQGEVNSIFELSLLYKKGLGTNKNSIESYKLLKKSALYGHKQAKNLIKI